MGLSQSALWLKQAYIDEGDAPGVSTIRAKRIKDLEQEVRELKRRGCPGGSPSLSKASDDNPLGMRGLALRAAGPGRSASPS